MACALEQGWNKTRTNPGTEFDTPALEASTYALTSHVELQVKFPLQNEINNKLVDNLKDTL